MGLETAAIVSIAVGASLTAGGMAVSAASSRRAAEENREQFNESMDFQREMFDAENAEWQRRFDVTNSYNSPTNVVSRYAEIGLNAAAAYGVDGGQSAFGAATPSVQQHSVPAAPYANLSGSADLGSSLEKLGSFVSSVSSAFKDTAEGNKVVRTTGAMVQNLELANELEKLNVMSGKIDYLVKKDTSLAKAWQDIKLMNAQEQLNIVLGKKYNEESALLRFQQFTEIFKGKKMQKEFEQFLEMAPLLIAGQKKVNQLYGEQILTEQARQSAEYASAEESRAGANLKNEQATSEKVLRDYDVNLKKWQSQEAAKRCNLSEVEFRQRLAELCQAEDKSKFLDDHPMIKRAISYLQSVGDAATLGVLKGIVTLK